VPTTAADAVELLDLLDDIGAEPVVVGGWGVDALAGRVTRVHRDLDVLVRADRVDAAIEACSQLGYEPGVDWLPVRIELDDHGADRHVDLHPAHDGAGGWWQHGLDGARFDYPADVLTAGTIGRWPVTCLTVAKQAELHAGYDPRPEDHHDLAVLGSLAS
jgi:lincosamide nucleotidyltransferase A/C/D/E